MTSGSVFDFNSIVAPSWGWTCRFQEGVLIVESEEMELALCGVNIDSIRLLLAKIDGYRTVRELAEISGLALIDTQLVISHLLKSGAAYRVVADASLVTIPTFIRICRQQFPIWKERLFSQPLWQKLSTGEATQGQFLGWAIESYHFIEGVNDRLALAVARCENHAIRSQFAKHYAEEYDHGDYFFKSLLKLGITEEEILTSRRLPGTTAILNHMRNCARQDPLQYAVCSGFLESTGGDRERARMFFTNLTAHYTDNSPLSLKPMVDHLSLDEAYGHNDLLEGIVQCIPTLTIKRAHGALNAGRQLVETLLLWSAEIERHYLQPSRLIRTEYSTYHDYSLGVPREHPVSERKQSIETNIVN